MKKEFTQINLLHILNDGFKASLMLFLPLIAAQFRVGMTQVGFLGGVVNSLDIILALPAGYFASKFGGKSVLIGTVFFWAFGYLITGMAPHYSSVVIGFVIAGIGFGMFHPVSFALVTHMFDKATRGKQLGNFTALGEVGRVGLSSIITVVIIVIGWRSTAIAVFVILLCIGLSFLYLDKKHIYNVDKLNEPKTQTSYKALLKNKKFLFASLSNCFDALASGSLFIFIPFLLLQRHVPYMFVGVLTSTFFIGSMFGKVLLGSLIDRIGNVKVFIISELSMAILIVALSNITWIPALIVTCVILGIFTKGTVPVVNTMVSESVHHQVGMEKVFSLNALFVGVASTCAPILLGYFSDTFGIIMAFNVSAVFALCAIIPAFLMANIIDISH